MMNPPNPNFHQLSQQQLAVLRAVLVPFADKIRTGLDFRVTRNGHGAAKLRH
jgi:hypothetical protein